MTASMTRFKAPTIISAEPSIGPPISIQKPSMADSSRVMAPFRLSCITLAISSAAPLARRSLPVSFSASRAWPIRAIAAAAASSPKIAAASANPRLVPARSFKIGMSPRKLPSESRTDTPS